MFRGKKYQESAKQIDKAALYEVAEAMELVVKGMLPVRKIALICNQIIIALLGQLMNLIAEGLDSGFESFGWLLLYLVCAMKLVGKEEHI